MDERRQSHPPPAPESQIFEAIAGSSGFAIGRALVLDSRKTGGSHRRIQPGQEKEELRRFDQAVLIATRELREVSERVKASRGIEGAEASILDAYLLMVGDPTLRDEVKTRIVRDQHSVEWALEEASDALASALRQTDDPYLAERSHDFEFVRDRIQRALSGDELSVIPEHDEPVVIVARDLSPAETATFTKERVLGIVTEVGTRTSHTAILARALEIPAVVGVRGLLGQVASGDTIVVDGVHGRVVLSPTHELLEELEPKAARYYQVARGRRAQRDEPAKTSCGVPVTLLANIELAVEAKIALEQGARGVGLYRTEFLYVDRSEPPNEEEQYEAYRRVVQEIAPLPVTLRTFDIGGDKAFSAVPVPEDMNPALGLRAVRLGLERPELFKTQLRAMVRASAHGPIQIMIPMVASLSEVRAVRALLSECIAEVRRAQHAHADHIPLGCMIEVPSAAILAEVFARESEFLSIGTNDLVQYALAVDRTSRELARLASYFDPAVVRLIKGVVDAGRFRKRPVSVCGAMASDPLAALLLVGMGLRTLSLEASAIPEVKEALSRVTLAELEDASGIAFEASTARELEQGFAERFAPLLADILDPG